MPSTPHEHPPGQPRLHFIANGIFCDAVAGGDIHFFQMAKAASAAGHQVHFFGGHALRQQLQQRLPGAELTLTDRRQLPPFDPNSLPGQFRLLWDYARRFKGTLRQLSKIRPEDAVYAVSDYWFDVLPAVFCRARRKLMVLHMQAPSLGQIIRRGRPDVSALRLPSIYYWLSQNSSLAAFRRCRHKRLLHVHPAMRPRLLRRGYHPEELIYISFGVDTALAQTAGSQPKIYDVVWIGRVHRQKGIDDLFATLAHLHQRVPNFRAVLIGNLKNQLAPLIDEYRLSDCVEFSGFVSEAEKFRLFHASRLFLMTSRFEGSPRVVAEALVCGVPVVAYDVPTYCPLYGELVQYIPCFDLHAFEAEAERQVLQMRNGKNYLDELDLDRFRHENSWGTTEQVFLDALAQLTATTPEPCR